MKIKSISYIAGVGVFVFLMLAGCATPYQPFSGMGGYWDKKIGENTFQVFFSGNGYTSRDAEYAFFLHRCAEVTIANGHDYFVIQKYDDFELLKKHDTGGGMQADINTFKGDLPAGNPAAFDAHQVLQKNAPNAKEYKKVLLSK
ncbi:MAG: hypothetical protein EPO07_17145 [Verrucomicrobia bacterium]|nr:MAG: hypothetical protein EPO07_17145 [Verrucomicrobiota bacterium]